MMSLTSDDYVEKDGLFCPSCESRNIGSVDRGTSHDDASFTVGIHCNACKAKWSERYVLESYFDLENESDE